MELSRLLKGKIYSLLSMRQRRQYLENNRIRKLHLGCGNNRLEGWLNTDLKYRSGGISYLDVSRPFPFDCEVFDFVFCEHLIEHLTYPQTLNMLRECHRVMKRGGIFRISMPSMEFLFDLWKKPDEPRNREYVQWAARRFLGNAGTDYDENHAAVYVIGNFFRDFGHRFIHSHESLKSLLMQAGFRDVETRRVGWSEIPELCGLERHGSVIPAEFNSLETHVVEAKK